MPGAEDMPGGGPTKSDKDISMKFYRAGRLEEDRCMAYLVREAAPFRQEAPRLGNRRRRVVGHSQEELQLLAL